jgi:hypothetical protein
MATTDTSRIREHMPVVCSNGGQFATVDKVEGDHLKLTKDQQGQHHWIPTSWITRVDDKVHVDRPGQQAMQQWMSQPPRTQSGQMQSGQETAETFGRGMGGRQEGGR